MIAYCLGSSSEGNCYLLNFHNDEYDKSIMIECGFTYTEITKRTMKNGLKACECLKNVSVCLVTHNHNDHSKSVNELLVNGIKVYATQDVFDARKTEKCKFNARLIKPNKDYVIEEGIYIRTFSVEHDAPNSLGFIIYCKKTNETILFVNDCKYFAADLTKFKFDYIFIETNYHALQLYTIYNLAVKEKSSDAENYKRVLDVHMSIETASKIVSSLNLERCKGIFLMHLSERNSNENLFKKTMIEKTSINKVYICKKNGGFA